MARSYALTNEMAKLRRLSGRANFGSQAVSWIAEGGDCAVVFPNHGPLTKSHRYNPGGVGRLSPGDITGLVTQPSLPRPKNRLIRCNMNRELSRINIADGQANGGGLVCEGHVFRYRPMRQLCSTVTLRRVRRVCARAGMVLALVPCRRHEVRDSQGSAQERYTGEFFFVGWYPVESMDVDKFVEVSSHGRRIFVTAEALELLDGKELVVKEVEVGVPTPADKKINVLVIRG